MSWFRRHRQDFVIVERFVGGGRRWFRYHPNRVWVWTKHPDRASLFESREAATHAALSCSVSWQHRWVIESHEPS